MIQISRFSKAGRIALPALAIAAIGVGGFVFGPWSSREIQAQADEASPARSHEISEKCWVTAQEVLDRFPMAEHQEFMRQAIANSRTAGVENRTGGAFGAVIVNADGQIIAQGSNHVVSNFDPTWHGEIEAIRNACANLKTLKLDGCLLYSSAEPCPMCLSAAYWAGLDGIIYGATTADSKKYGGFDDAFLYQQFLKPVEARDLPEIQLFRAEAVQVWKEYASLPDNVNY